MWGYVDIQIQSYSEIKENMCMNIVKVCQKKVCQTVAFGVSSPPSLHTVSNSSKISFPKEISGLQRQPQPTNQTPM